MSLCRSPRLLVVLALVICAANQAAASETNRSVFQRLLDLHGIPLQLPARGKFILVNVPAFEVIAFRDATPVLRSRAIVGTPWNRTPLRSTHVSTVRFRPSWRPTPSMVASGEYRDGIRPPGESNPLGLAAVRLEPGLLVYLHDTNRPELFAREDRALSHGCIRVERWDELVAFVLDVDLATVHALAHGNRTIDMPAEKIPVELGYYLSFPDQWGRLGQYRDIYGLQDRAEGIPPASAPVSGTCEVLPG